VIQLTRPFRNGSGRGKTVLTMTASTRSPRRAGSAEPRREALLTDFALTPISAAERRQAALAVCDRAATVDEARELLDALGLLDAASLRGAA
jgi:hypothetical protein